MNNRTTYILSLCREKALQGDIQLMMVREPSFHAEILMQGAFRQLITRNKGRIQIIKERRRHPRHR